MIFRAKKDLPVEIVAWVGGEGGGWFTLERKTPGGLGGYDVIAASMRAPDASENITHQFTAAEIEKTEWASLILRLKANVLSQAGQDMPLFLDVKQNGASVKCVDYLGTVLNADGKTSFQRVALDDVPSNKPSLTDFSIYFE